MAIHAALFFGHLTAVTDEVRAACAGDHLALELGEFVSCAGHESPLAGQFGRVSNMDIQDGQDILLLFFALAIRPVDGDKAPGLAARGKLGSPTQH
jgi:hypothetical protein